MAWDSVESSRLPVSYPHRQGLQSPQHHEPTHPEPKHPEQHEPEQHERHEHEHESQRERPRENHAQNSADENDRRQRRRQRHQQQQQQPKHVAMPPSPSSSDDARSARSGAGSNGSSALNSAGGRRQWQWARSADWDVHRARITELYRDRGLHLDQVIEIMVRDHGFYASPRMYKTRISKWAIDKNYKAADVACMLLLKRQRAAQGKTSSFILRGRKVDWAKIEQYLKRDSTLLRRLEAGDDLLDLVPGHAQNSGIICRTPSPSPPPHHAKALPLPHTTTGPLSSMTNSGALGGIGSLGSLGGIGGVGGVGSMGGVGGVTGVGGMPPMPGMPPMHAMASMPLSIPISMTPMSMTSMAPVATVPSMHHHHSMSPLSSMPTPVSMVSTPMSLPSSSSSSTTSILPSHMGPPILSTLPSSTPSSSASPYSTPAPSWAASPLTLPPPTLGSSASVSSVSSIGSLPYYASAGVQDDAHHHHQSHHHHQPHLHLQHSQYGSSYGHQGSATDSLVSSAPISPSRAKLGPLDLSQHQSQLQSHHHHHQPQQHLTPNYQPHHSRHPQPTYQQSLPSAPAPPRVLAAPSELRLPEEIARLARDYCLGALEQGLWVRDHSGHSATYVSVFAGQDGADRLRLWGQKMRVGRHLIASGDVDAGFQRVGSCMDVLRQHMQEQDPSLLFHLLGNTFGHTAALRTLAASLCGYIREMARILLGNGSEQASGMVGMDQGMGRFPMVSSTANSGTADDSGHPLARLFGRLLSIVTSDDHFAVLPLPLQVMADVLRAHDGGASFAFSPIAKADCERFSMLLLSSPQPSRIDVSVPSDDKTGSSAYYYPHQDSLPQDQYHHPPHYPYHPSLTASTLSPPSSSPSSPMDSYNFSTSMSDTAATATTTTASATSREGTPSSSAHHLHSTLAIRSPDDQAELQRLIGMLEPSRDIHVRTRFFHTYLAYLSRVGLAANASAMARNHHHPSSLLPSSQTAAATSHALAAAVAASEAARFASSSSASSSPSGDPATAAESDEYRRLSKLAGLPGNYGFSDSPADMGFSRRPGSSQQHALIAGYPAVNHDAELGLVTHRDVQHYYIVNIHLARAPSPLPSKAGSMAATTLSIPPSIPSSTAGTVNTTPRAMLSVTAVSDTQDGADHHSASLSRELEDVAGMDWVLP